MSNELTMINKGITNIVGKLYDDIDFTKLDNIIDKIGNNTGSLSSDERVSACKYIEDWDNVVVTRINKKIDTLNQIMALIKHDNFEIFINQKNTLDIFASFSKDIEDGIDKLSSLYQDYIDFNDSKPDNILIDNTLSVNEINEQKAKYKYELAKFTFTQEKKMRKCILCFKELKKILKKDDNIQKMIKTCGIQKDNLITVRGEFKEKASLAKMNVLISSPEIRKSLIDMSLFVKTQLN